MQIPFQIQDFEDGGQCVQEWCPFSLSGTEPEVNCTNCEEFENKLQKVLVELSTVQLKIKLLQKELNMTLVLGSEHNLR